MQTMEQWPQSTGVARPMLAPMISSLAPCLVLIGGSQDTGVPGIGAMVQSLVLSHLIQTAQDAAQDNAKALEQMALATLQCEDNL